MTLPAIDHSVYINAAPEKVFDALTNAQGWDAWFTKGMTLDPRVGGEITFRWEKWGPDHVTAEDRGKILEILSCQKFSFLWNLHEGGTTVTFTLQPRASGTVLRITDQGYKSVDYFMTCATGWGEALALLKFCLEHGVVYGSVP